MNATIEQAWTSGLVLAVAALVTLVVCLPSRWWRR